jgi:hypothetical protein
VQPDQLIEQPDRLQHQHPDTFREQLAASTTFRASEQAGHLQEHLSRLTISRSSRAAWPTPEKAEQPGLLHNR